MLLLVLVLMAADADASSVAAARLFVPQISASVGVPLHAVQLLTGGRQLTPLMTEVGGGAWSESDRTTDRIGGGVDGAK